MSDQFLKLWEYESIQELATDFIEESAFNLVDDVALMVMQLETLAVHQIQNLFYSTTGKELG